MQKLFSMQVIFIFTMAIALLLSPAVLRAQDDKEMQVIVDEINEKYSKKVEQALKKDMNRFNKMKGDMEEIEKIKDNPGKKKGLDNYKKNHKEHFGKAIKEAGVDLNQLLKNMQAKYPDYLFSISEEYGIMIEKKSGETADGGLGMLNSSEVNSYGTGSGPNPGYANTFSFYMHHGESFFQDLLFTQNKSVNCALGSGGNVEFGQRMVRAWSTGVVAGGCNSTGILLNQTLLPASGVQSIKLNLNGTVECAGYALGIFGTATTTASTHIRATIKETNTGLLGGSLESYKLALAPILWYASFNDYKNKSFNIDMTPWKGKTIEIRGYGYSSSASVICCGTNSSAKANIITASLQIVK
jgi:hypothetical protein